MNYEIGDRYHFPTSSGYETSFDGCINRITDKAVEFVSRSGRCVNHGHSACNVRETCWLPKSVIEKHYLKYDDMYKTHTVIPPFWMNVFPRLKHEFHLNKENK